jgi:hypothetical protein
VTHQRVVTLGVDLAAQRAKTAVCVIAWEPPSAEIMRLSLGLDDDHLLALVDEFAPEKIAIDAPFGWPRPFVAAVVTYASTGDWPAGDISPLRLRDTDRVVIGETRQHPLSVSSDRIAVTAMRCARLLTRLRQAGHVVSRDGAGLAAEVYPAAALRLWGLDPHSYKGTKAVAREKRRQLAEDIRDLCSSWLATSNDHLRLLAESDHNLDAFVCATLARVVGRGLAKAIPLEHRDAAALEGWIHLPQPDALGRVAAD